MELFYCLQLTSLLIVLLDRFPLSLQQRSKRQIIFPEDDGRTATVVGSPCTTPDRRDGDCVRLTQCQVLLRLSNYNRLRRWFCGFEGNEPRVCCPLPNGDGGGNPTPTRRTTRRTTIATTPRPIRRTTRPNRRPTTPRRPSRTSPTPQNIQSTPSPSSRRMPDFLPRDCGKNNSTLNRVVGGEEAEHGSWPWMAVVYQERRGVKSPDCGGALVTNQHVITAAHCVVGRRGSTLNPNVLSVRLGEHDLYSDDDDMSPVDVDVVSVEKHENFNSRTYENDIAVLKLARRVRFENSVAPICLPYDDDELFGENLAGRSAFVAGWGTTSFNGPASSKLMQASIPVQEQDFCRTAYRDDVPITSVYLCAGMLDGTKDSCQGDSGGPLMAVGRGRRYYIVGVVSFGKLCGTPGYPGVYTRVTEFLDWLTPKLRS